MFKICVLLICALLGVLILNEAAVYDRFIMQNMQSPAVVNADPDSFSKRDLEEGLRSLNPFELKTLSDFVDEQSKIFQGEEHGPEILRNVVADYWKRHVLPKRLKKKRTMDDLYDELAHENAGESLQSESAHRKVNTEMCVNCNCPCGAMNVNEKIMRTKRENDDLSKENANILRNYVRNLEESFPREHLERSLIHDCDQSREHVRIKRLRHHKVDNLF